MPAQPTRRAVVRSLIGLPVAAVLPATGSGQANPIASLAHEARRSGRFFGAAVRPEQLAADDALREAVLRDCSAITAEIHTNWTEIEATRGDYRFRPADQLLAFAEQEGLVMRGHSLLWDQSTPEWAKRDMAERRDWRLIERYSAEMLGRFGSRIEDWEVVNEPIDSEDGAAGGIRRTCFQRAFGSRYIRDALETARAFAPAARLMINDYGFDYDNGVEERRRACFLRLIEGLKRDGVPLQAVGVQAHLDLSKGPLRPRLIGGFLRELAGFGLDIVITELDVKEVDLRAPLTVRDRRVADEARTYLDIALAEPAVKGIVTWGLSDRHSWLQDQSAGLPPVEAGGRLNRGLPYDAALAPKPMYWAMRNALRRA